MTTMPFPSTAALNEPLSFALGSRIRRVAEIDMPGPADPPLRDALDKLIEAREIIARQNERIAHLESLATTDELTGLLNRRGFNERFAGVLSATKRDESLGGALVMIDLDGFKSVNDTHGHLAGDAYLRRVARLLASLVRDEDVTARLGGDEFAVLITGCDAETASARAREIAEAARAEHMEWGGVTLPIRFSFGVEAFRGDDKAEVVIRRADVRMYREKSARRRAA